MKKIFFVFSIVFTVHLHAQKTIKLEEASSHVGDSVHVCGKVYEVKFFKTASTSYTFINLGAPYPRQLLSIVIAKDARAAFEKTPEELFENKSICVDGKIELYKGRPQIEVTDKKQVNVQ